MASCASDSSREHRERRFRFQSVLRTAFSRRSASPEKSASVSAAFRRSRSPNGPTDPVANPNDAVELVSFAKRRGAVFFVDARIASPPARKNVRRFEKTFASSSAKIPSATAAASVVQPDVIARGRHTSPRARRSPVVDALGDHRQGLTQERRLTFAHQKRLTFRRTRRPRARPAAAPVFSRQPSTNANVREDALSVFSCIRLKRPQPRQRARASASVSGRSGEDVSFAFSDVSFSFS